MACKSAKSTNKHLHTHTHTHTHTHKHNTLVQDINVQHLKNTGAIAILEKIARFFIVAGHEMTGVGFFLVVR